MVAKAPRLDREAPPRGAEIVVVGAGIVGAAIGARLAKRGLDVCVVDRGGPAAGTSSSGEGNVLVSDKLPGSELDLALRGTALWREVADRAAERVEFEDKGGLVVARDDLELEALWSLARAQQAAGAVVELVGAEQLREHEPAICDGLAGGAYYPQDCQVQPMLAAAFHLEELARCGGCFVAGTEVLGAGRDGDGAISRLSTSKGEIAVGRAVVNAAGPWAGVVAKRLGGELAVEPRRGHVLVTEPLPPVVRHKVYEADYVGSIHQQAGAWATSAVVESTRSGTMLLGSSREFVGFSERPNPEIVAEIAARSVALFPALGDVRLLRCYVGFRPATPDRLPIIGRDPVVGGFLHATGHEGAGVGLAQVTAEIVEALVVGEAAPLDLAPFSPGRFPHAVGAAPSRAAGPSGPSRGAGPSREASPSGPFSPSGGASPSGWAGPSRGASPSARGDDRSREEVGAPPARPDASGAASVRFRFDGRLLSAPWGASIAGALLAQGERAWRTTRTGAQRRGIFCGIGTCFDCLVELNGRPGVRACCTLLSEGDDVRSSDSFGSFGTPAGVAPASAAVAEPDPGAPSDG